MSAPQLASGWTPDSSAPGMQIRVGFEVEHESPSPTPMIPTLNIHYSRASDLLHPDLLRSEPTVPVAAYRDQFDNWRSRIVAPPGRFLLNADTVVRDSGLPDLVACAARQIAVVQMPESNLAYLMGSRCCETDRLSEVAWQRFGDGPTGWGRVQAICHFVNGHIDFG